MTRGSGAGSQTRLSQLRQKRQRPNDKCLPAWPPCTCGGEHHTTFLLFYLRLFIFLYSTCILLLCVWTHSIYIHTYLWRVLWMDCDKLVYGSPGPLGAPHLLSSRYYVGRSPVIHTHDIWSDQAWFCQYHLLRFASVVTLWLIITRTA